MKKLNRILIVGAGEAGIALAGDLRQRSFGESIAGFIDDDKSKIGAYLSGVEVYGPTSEIDLICEKLRISNIIIAIPSASSSFINNIVSRVLAFDRNINLYFVPSAEKFFDSVPIFPSLREFSYSELLERDEFTIDLGLMEKYFSGKSILITGAGGSIGSEICRQLLKFRVRKIIAVGRGESSIYNLQKDMDDFLRMMNVPGPEVQYRIIDVKDYRLLDRLFYEEKPGIVFHAAAHKHVPLMEFNEIEALQNNVLGTNNLLELSVKHSAGKFILISTDKAVRPANIMGATKRISELLTSYYRKNSGLNTACVRFGNVLGSRGSVIPLFRDQIEKGGPVTVTHPDIVRYFMSIPEASLLVINSAAISEGGEIFVLDMGKQFKISDIAERMIELYGYIPGKDIMIEYTGLRPGEKLYEELYYNKGEMIKTGNNKILKLKNDNGIMSADEFTNLIKSVKDEAPYMNSMEVREFIKKYVPEYNY
jgi:FlaA1/EpsC-like NDP-sugar epimerase